MSDKLVVMLNGDAVVEYDRSVRLPGHQRQYLDRMDADMDEGIELAGEAISSPDNTQRAKFVAMHLAQALLDSHDAMIAAGCAYLANRLPELQQVRIIQEGEDIMLDLVFDKAPDTQVLVQFHPDMSNKRKH